jgi:Arc/MetJ-type ribon-helix-helix transcriptional regulator
MVPVQVRLTKKLIERIDELVDRGIYSNRSEAIRDAARRLVMEVIETPESIE